MNNEQALSLLTDPRLPIYLPINLIKWKSIEKEISSVSEIDIDKKPRLDVVFSADIEYDYALTDLRESVFVKPFFKMIASLLKSNIRSTLFIQANLLETLSADMPNSDSCEFGIHGFAHEPWSNEWFLQKPSPTISKRRALLSESVETFQKIFSEKPKIFRAPYMALDQDSRSLLNEFDFQIDSSYPSFRGGKCIISSDHKQKEIPVSFDPMPTFSKIGSSKYFVFNTKNLANTNYADVKPKILRIMKHQIYYKQNPHLVILVHPWEFFDLKANLSQENKRSFGYSNSQNFDKIKKFLDLLSVDFDVEYKTISEIK